MGTIGVAGLASADRTIYVEWEFPDGRTERIEATAFDRRSDTPSIDTLELDEDCCDCPDPTRCVCIDPPC